LQINGETNKVWTFRDILEQSLIMARTLHGVGIKQNDVISIISENRFEVVAISFGAFFLNAIVAPINPTYTERKFFCLFFQFILLIASFIERLK
jgi:acyl-CoA synthetase (AMP-forming)/AMP-acid ligase II